MSFVVADDRSSDPFPSGFLVVAPYLDGFLMVVGHLGWLSTLSVGVYVVENTIVRFTRNNFPTWKFQFRIFLKGKALSTNINSDARVPTYEKDFVHWEFKDAKVISWLLWTIEPHLVTNLCYFTTAKTMWDYLPIIIIKTTLPRIFNWN